MSASGHILQMIASLKANRELTQSRKDKFKKLNNSTAHYQKTENKSNVTPEKLNGIKLKISEKETLEKLKMKRITIISILISFIIFFALFYYFFLI